MGKFRIKVAITLTVFVLAMVGVCAVFGILSYNKAEAQYQELYVTNAVSVRDEAEGLLAKTNRTLSDYSSVVNSLNKYSFSRIAVLSTDGALIASTDDGFASDFVNSLGDKGKDAFLNKDGATCTVTSDGEKTLFVFAPYTDTASERYVAVLPYSAHSKTMSNQLLITVFQSLSVVVVTFACCFILTMLYKNRNELLPKVKPAKNYILTVKANGTVIAANKKFNEQFNVKNVCSGYEDNGVAFSVALSDGYPIICAFTALDGSVKQIAFSAVSAKVGYKLIGSDMTDILADYEAIRVQIKKNPKTGLFNESVLDANIEKIKKFGSLNSCAYVQMRVQNLDYYHMLFGDVAVANGTREYAEFLKNEFAQYGELYSLTSGDLALIAEGKQKRDKLINNIAAISSELAKPITIENNLLQIDVRIGVVLLDAATESTSIEAIKLNGNRAVKNACEHPHTPYYVLRSAAFNTNKHDLSTKEGILDLMASGLVDVWFQPQYNVVENKVVGFEALFRIVGESAKEINVFEFIAAAERNGQIVELGKFIYERAMDFAVVMQEFGVTVSINVSPIQLMQVGFVEAFLEAYNRKKLRSGSIDVEIVESTIIYSLNEVVKKLTILSKNGIGTHIDDFGVAYSSMLYLKRLPVTTLKIDKAFIDGIVDSKESYLIVKNIVNICSDLGLGCIAEGVETDAQVALLKQIGCSVIQGFWMSGAVPKEKAYAFIKEKNK